jgi:hypothetical protein
VDIAEEMVAHCPFDVVAEANQGVGPQIEDSPYLEPLSIAIKASDHHIQGIHSKDHMHFLEEAWVVLDVQGVVLSVEGSEVLLAEVPAVHLEGSFYLHLLVAYTDMHHHHRKNHLLKECCPRYWGG